MDILMLFWEPIAANRIFIGVALVLIVLDIVVGFSNAVAHREVSSSKMRSGLWHKLGSVFLMAAADIIDAALLGGVDLGIQAPMLVAVCVYISIMELISVVENCVKLNPDLADNPIIGVVSRRTEEAE